MIKPNWFVSVTLASLALLPAQYAGAWGRFEGGHHPAYGGTWAHRSPVIVHRTYVNGPHGGCVGCGIVGAAVVGLVGGAIIGSAMAHPNPPPVEYVQTPPPVEYVPAGPQVGMEVANLPPGCASMSVNGGQYYQCGPTWYQPYFGGNGVYYTVVPAP